MLAAFPRCVYLEIRTEREPTTIAVITGDATRLPNSLLTAGELPQVTVGDEAAVGDGSVELGSQSLRARRWWDPAPPLPPVDLRELAGSRLRLNAYQGRTPGLVGNEAVALLTEGCAAGSLVDSITAAERLIGLGPGLTPSGDDVLAGVLLALRHLGAAARVGRAVWLADWLATTVTFDARTRTTPISATLLYCAARGEASPEVTEVLRALAESRPPEAALGRLDRLGHTSGADLTQGLRIGVTSVLTLSGTE